MRTNWAAVKADYITGIGTVPKLAERYGISVSSIQKRMAKEKWAAEKEQYCKRIAEDLQKSVADMAKNETLSSMRRMNGLAERLMDRIEESIEQLERRAVSHKSRKKEFTYVERGAAKGKTKVETIDQGEKLTFIAGDVDRAGVKQLASALVDVKSVLDVNGIASGDGVEIDFNGAEELAQ